MGDRLDTVDMGRKVGVGCCAPFRGGDGSHVTQCRLGRGLSPYKWHPYLSSRLATIDMGRKLGAAVPLFFWGGRAVYVPIDLSNRLAAIHQRYRQTGNGPIA